MMIGHSSIKVYFSIQCVCLRSTWLNKQSSGRLFAHLLKRRKKDLAVVVGNVVAGNVVVVVDDVAVDDNGVVIDDDKALSLTFLVASVVDSSVTGFQVIIGAQLYFPFIQTW